MKTVVFPLFILLLCVSCNIEKPTAFIPEALQDELLDIDENSITLNEILEKNKGKQIVIDVWASWCRDCIEGLPDLRELQKKNDNTVFVFLSLDRTTKAWKNGISTYKIRGDHYYLKSGFDGPIGDFLNLSWIPRYTVIGTDGNIKLFKATRASDPDIQEALDN